MPVWIRNLDTWVLAGSPITNSVTPIAIGTAAIGDSNESATANHVHAGSFADLADTAASLGSMGQIPAVNSAESALEFIDASTVGASIPYNNDASIPAPIALTGADGDDTEVARFDHIHAGSIGALDDGNGEAVGFGDDQIDEQFLRANNNATRARWATLPAYPAETTTAPVDVGITASVGAGTGYALPTHVHKGDITELDRGDGTVLGNGSNDQFLRSDGVNAQWGTLSIPSPATVNPLESNTTEAASPGTSDDYARGNHRHGLNPDVIDDRVDVLLGGVDTTTVTSHSGIVVHYNDNTNLMYLEDRIDVSANAPTTNAADNRPDGNVWIEV